MIEERWGAYNKTRFQQDNPRQAFNAGFLEGVISLLENLDNGVSPEDFTRRIIEEIRGQQRNVTEIKAKKQ